MRNKPRIRFKGFTEDWEQRKLGDIATFSKGNGYSKSDLGSSGDPIILYGRLYTNYETTISNVDTFVELKDKSIISQGGEVIVPASGETAEDISRASVVKNQGIIIGGDLNVIKANYLLDPTFLALTISNGEQQKELSKRAQGKSVVHLHNSDLQEVNLTFPLLNEQKEISTLFEKMDNIITLHQRKLEKLKLAKKALLQKLFPKNGSKFPELRFKGFADAWEQRKLCQITTRVTRKNGDQSDLPLTISAQDGLVDQRKYFNRQVASRDMSNYYLIKKGEFAYNKSYSEGYPFGAVKRLDYYDIGALSTLYILFEITDNNISSDFIVSYYMTHLWYKEISKRAAEGARNHGLLNISTEDFFDSELNIPNSIEEQVKIGNFIKQFDKFITLHQRKLDKLQEVKKGLLQKMFV